MRIPLTTLCAALTASVAFADAPCGQGAACEIDDGSYHLIAPPDWDGATPLPALIFFHGYNSSAASVFRSGGLRTDFVDRGYLLIAPNGAKFAGGDARGWPSRPTWAGRDDAAFTLAVLQDAAARVPVDMDRVYASGFSAGGSMAWMLACYAGDRLAGVAPVAGALRRPHPEGTCPSGPVPLFQFHGFADRQVPFEGRAIGDWHQGDIFASLSLLRATNNCRSNPDDITIDDRFRCREWAASCGEAAIKMCEHDSGHGLPRGWTALARDWFEAQQDAN